MAQQWGWRRFAPVLTLAAAAVLALGLVVTAANGSVSAQDSGASVSIKDFAFQPGTVQITAGSTVTWTNNESGVAHTVTADDGSFDSGTLQPGQSFSQTFNTPGTFAYHCAIHPNMTAMVVVTDANNGGGAGAVATAPAANSGAGVAATMTGGSDTSGGAAATMTATGPASTAAAVTAGGSASADVAGSGTAQLPNTGAGTSPISHDAGIFLIIAGLFALIGLTRVRSRRRG